ncbi:hypothetical protein ACWEJ6_52660 [Nonomuraea sp. NPDC004702]
MIYARRIQSAQGMPRTGQLADFVFLSVVRTFSRGCGPMMPERRIIRAIRW